MSKIQKKILIVDDSKIARVLLRKELENIDCVVVGDAENGQIGLEKYKELKPDIVFSDLEMPVLDGCDMLRQIKEFDSNAQVVIITSVSNHRRYNELKLLEVSEIMEKPINHSKIEEIINKLEYNTGNFF